MSNFEDVMTDFAVLSAILGLQRSGSILIRVCQKVRGDFSAMSLWKKRGSYAILAILARLLWARYFRKKVQVHINVPNRARAVGRILIGDKWFFREHVTECWRHVVPKALKEIAGAWTYDEFVVGDPLPAGPESILNGTAKFELVPVGDTVKGAVGLGYISDGIFHGIGGGVRFYDLLITSAHIVLDPKFAGYSRVHSLCLDGHGKQVEVDLTKCERFILPKSYSPDKHSGTGYDIVAYRIPLDLWSAIGVGSNTRKALCKLSEGVSVVYGNPDGEWVRSIGALMPNTNHETKFGLGSFAGNTVSGFSGFPHALKRNGVWKILGIHCCGDAFNLGTNHFVMSDSIDWVLRLAGYEPPNSLKQVVSNLLRGESVLAESKGEARKAAAWAKYMDWLEKKDSLLAELERAAEEEILDRMYGDDTGAKDEDEAPPQRRWADQFGPEADEGFGGNWQIDWDRYPESCFAKGPESTTDPRAKAVRRLAREYVRRTLAPITDPTREEIEEAIKGAIEAARKFLEDIEIEVELPGGVVDFFMRDKHLAESKTKEGEPPVEATVPLPKFKQVLKKSELPAPSATQNKQPNATQNTQNTQPNKTFIPPALAAEKKDETEIKLPLPSDRKLQSRKRQDYLYGAAHIRFANKQASKAHINSDGEPAELVYDNVVQESYTESHLNSFYAHNILRDHVDPSLVQEVNQAISEIDSLVGIAAFGEKFSYEEAISSDFFREYLADIDSAGAKFTGVIGTESGRKGKFLLNEAGEEVFVKRGTAPVHYTRKVDSATPIPLSAAFVEACLKCGVDLRDPTEETLSAFFYPPDGPDGSFSSIRDQAKKIRNTDLSRATKDFGFYENMYSQVPQYTILGAASGLNTKLQKIYDSFDGTKSSGWSARTLPGPKGAWLDTEGGRRKLTYHVLCRMLLRAATGSGNLGTMSPSEMVSKGLADPKVISTKKEAHTSKKKKRGAWRQIWVQSIVDAVCQSLLCSDKNKTDIAAFSDPSVPFTGSFVGLGHHDEGISEVGARIDEIAAFSDGTICAADGAHWDLSVNRESILLTYDARVYALRASSMLEKARIAELLYCEAFCNTAHILSVGGDLWEDRFYGHTASGIQNTSEQNTWVRKFLLELAGSPFAGTVGDDGMYVPGVDEELLLSFGTETRDFQRVPAIGPIDFTSHRFEKIGGVWTAQFLNLNKMLANIFFRSKGGVPCPDAIGGMLFALRNTPESLDKFFKISEHLGWDTHVVPAYYEDLE